MSGATAWTVTVRTTGEAPTRADLESALSFAYGWTVTATPTELEAAESETAGDEYRPCDECGDDVRTLSSRDRCDACELEDEE